MHAIDLVEASSKTSDKLTKWRPLFEKVTKVITKHTFKIAPSSTPIDANNFWADDLDHKILSPAEKARLHLQLHRSAACDRHVLAFAQALKQLCESGVPLAHNGLLLADIWVLSANEFDVYDIPPTRILNLRVPISGITVPAMSTYENKEKLREIGETVCRRLGYVLPDKGAMEDTTREHYPKSYKSAVPHWWVAAILEGLRNGQLERRMLHIDICGAAYDDSGFRGYDRSLVSLQVFTTPVYNLCPGKLYQRLTTVEGISHKFKMSSHLDTTHGKSNMTITSLQPFSVRHLRCFHRNDCSAVGVIPIETFIERNKAFVPGKLEDWEAFVTKLRHDLVLQTPAGTLVVVCNLAKRPELNGRNGCVHECVTDEPPTERLPVWVKDVDNPLKIKTNCLRFSIKKQYSSFDAILKRVEKFNKIPEAEVTNMKPVSAKDQAAIHKALTRDQEMSQAFSTLVTGKMTVSFFADPKLVRGMRKLLIPPFDTILPPNGQIVKKMRDGLEVADHPKSAEAFKILKLFKAAKQKALDQNPAIMRCNGGLEMRQGSDFFQFFSKIVERIKSDQGLTEVFDMMDHKGLFPSPVKQMDRNNTAHALVRKTV